MTNGGSAPNAQAVTQLAHSPPKEQLSQVYNDAHTVNQPQPSKPGEIPTLSTNPSNGRTPELVDDMVSNLTDKLQQALRHIKVLETHQTKLYEDNCQLVAAVSMLNERLLFSGASHSTQVLHFAEVQGKLRTSEANRAKPSGKYQDMLASVSAGSPHQHLSVELQGTRNAYMQLDREYRILRDKYARLKGALGTGHVTQQQVPHLSSQGTIPVSQVPRGHNPIAYTQSTSDLQIRVPQLQGQSRSNPASPASAISPGSLQGSLQQQENHRRRSSECVSQQQHRPGPSSMATTWPPTIPTPPPSGSLYRGPMSPSGFPVYSSTQSVPVGVFPPHSSAHGASPVHTTMSHGSRSVSGPALLPQAHHLVGHDAVHVPNSQGTKSDLRHTKVIDLTQNQPGAAHDMQAGPPTPPKSSSPQTVHALKRPHSDTQASDSQQGELKKPRVEGEAPTKPVGPTTPGVDTLSQSPVPATSATPTAPPSAIPSPPAVTDVQVNGTPAVSAVDAIRSYQECVNLIFEKDADVEHGVFCGLCFDRYEAKMIQEPPDVLIQPNFDLLVKHCMTMHPTAWEDLRHPKDLGKTQ